MKTGIELIAEERQEQIEKHGRTIFRDAVENRSGQLVNAAIVILNGDRTYWPDTWKVSVCIHIEEKPEVERLAIAGALIAAEIDRLCRYGLRNDATEVDSKSPESTFEKELECLINKYSVENGSDTPDFIIAEFMSNCLVAYQQVVTKRDKWFGVDMWAADKISAQRKAEDQNH